MKKKELFQIQWQDDVLFDGLKPLRSSAKGEIFFEFPTITEFVENGLCSATYYGFFSPKFYEKMRIGIEDVVSYVEANDAEVYIFNPYQYKSCFYNNIMDDAISLHDKKAIEEIGNIVSNLYQKKILKIATNPVVWSYCNYWVMNGSTLKKFYDFYQPIMRQYISYESTHWVDVGYKEVTSCLPFIFERLLSVFLTLNPSIRVKNYGEKGGVPALAKVYGESLFLKLKNICIRRARKDIEMQEVISLVISGKIPVDENELRDVFWCPELDEVESNRLGESSWKVELQRFLDLHNVYENFKLNDLGYVNIYAESNQWIIPRIEKFGKKSIGLFMFIHYYLALNSFQLRRDHLPKFKILKDLNELFRLEFKNFSDRGIGLSDLLCACMFPNIQDAYNLDHEDDLDGFKDWLDINRRDQFYPSQINSLNNLNKLPRGSIDFFYFQNHQGGIGKDGKLFLEIIRRIPSKTIRTFNLAEFSLQQLNNTVSELSFFIAPTQELLKLKFKDDSFLKEYKKRIAFVQWELERAPYIFEWALKGFNQILVSSEFTKKSLSFNSNVKKILMPNLVLFDDSVVKPKDFIQFITMFDSWSYPERKNPYMAIKVFKKIPRKYNVKLTIKSSNLKNSPKHMEEILNLIDGDSRITLIDELMSEIEVYRLLQESNCMLSFQRSEGFGRTLLEAMCLGAYVISNDYSGCSEFSDSKKFIKCRYYAVPVRGAYPHGEGQYWAQTDFNSATYEIENFCNNFFLGRLDFNPELDLIDRYSLTACENELTKFLG